MTKYFCTSPKEDHYMFEGESFCPSMGSIPCDGTLNKQPPSAVLGIQFVTHLRDELKVEPNEKLTEIGHYLLDFLNEYRDQIKRYWKKQLSDYITSRLAYFNQKYHLAPTPREADLIMEVKITLETIQEELLRL